MQVWINCTFCISAEEWDDYFRQYPDDFMVEGFDGSPRKAGSGQGSPRGSPNQKHGMYICVVFRTNIC